MLLAPPAEYRFDRFRLVPGERRLLDGDRPVRLGARAFDTLLVLVEERERLVPKGELLERVWPHLVVEENNLQVQISMLRKLLGQEAIATVPALGYRFTLEVVSSGDASFALGLAHNLPRPLTSFIGHQEDLDDYTKLLATTRLFTLTGIGGCGKTRLAIRLAERALPSFQDGVRYFDLAPLLDAERLPLTVATGLDLREENDRSIVDTLCNRLASQHMLLILDNCEHLTAVCAPLAQRILDAAPGVHVLAASREALGVPGERAVTVRSLSFPPPASTYDRSTVAACEAVRLFVERAQLSAAGFSLTDKNTSAVAEICRRLDGIPLAIELAAARLKMLSIDEIRTRLDDRFRLLAGGSRAAIGRQQTLLATIQWSYEHLSAQEQRLLLRLSVFAGGWTLDGAVGVAGEAVDEYTVLSLLERLVDLSLVSTQRAQGGATRYTMLETVRQYAQDRLNESGEGEAARDRHLGFFLAFAERAQPEFFGSQQRACVARLDDELENLLAAHAWCDRESFAERGLRLVTSLHMYFREGLLIAMGRRVILEALARPGAQRRDVARSRALWVAGELNYYMGRYEETKSCVEESLAIAHELGNEDRIADALRLLGNLNLAQGDLARARLHCEEALKLSRRLDDWLHKSRALNELAEVLRTNGELEQADALYEEAALLSRERADRGGLAIHLQNRAMTCIALGRLELARNFLREGLALVGEVDSKRIGLGQLVCAAGLAACFEEWDRAARFHGAIRTLLEQMDYRLERADETFLAPLIARVRQVLGSEAFELTEAVGRTLSYDEVIAEARAWAEAR